MDADQIAAVNARIKPKARLPAKPSALIRMALVDLAWVEKHPKQAVVQMNTFVRYREGNYCEVCFAGAIMYHRMGIRDAQCDWTAMGFPVQNQRKFWALDDFRCGDVIGGLSHMFDTPDSKESPRQIKKWSAKFGSGLLYVIEYEKDPKQFRKDMNGMVRKLESVGL